MLRLSLPILVINPNKLYFKEKNNIVNRKKKCVKFMLIRKY